jgi:DNA repair protein RadC
MSNAGDPLSAVPSDDRPRERLARVGAAGLSDAEVLALVLGSGMPGRNVVSLANAVLAQSGGFGGLAAMDARQLQNLPGIGPASAGRLIAGVEMARRALLPESGTRLSDPASIAHLVLPELSDRGDERFFVLVADQTGRLRDVVRVREGTRRKARIASGEIIQSVLTRGGSTFAIAHNHVGGSLEPSVTDAALARQLRIAAKAVGLRFLDSIIVAGTAWQCVR